MQGDSDRIREEARSIYEQVEQTKVRWNIGELAYWLWRAGDLTTAPAYHFEPFELQMQGFESSFAFTAKGAFDTPAKKAEITMDLGSFAEFMSGLAGSFGGNAPPELADSST